ncbi:MAG TPA: hypothetical protein DCQ04_02895, partial [Actinobacteria bacterium]|nr:hypothetical protein [Actinomycetota bacterium]
RLDELSPVRTVARVSCGDSDGGGHKRADYPRNRDREFDPRIFFNVLSRAGRGRSPEIASPEKLQ